MPDGRVPSQTYDMSHINMIWPEKKYELMTLTWKRVSTSSGCYLSNIPKSSDLLTMDFYTVKLISSELFVVSKRMCTFDIRDWIFDIDISKWHMQHMICFITVINCYITTVRGYHRGRRLLFRLKKQPFQDAIDIFGMFAFKFCFNSAIYMGNK